MERRSECLDPDDVAAFLVGDLEPRDVDLLETHVARCAECRTLLSLAARSDSIAPSRSSASLAPLCSEPGVPGDTRGEPTPGARVGRYVLRERLGAGAMGVVFVAHDPELDRRVAVKVLRGNASDETSRTPLSARMLREARAMAQLAHPNVVAVHDVGSFGDRIFIAMELVDGQTLAQWLAAEGRPVREVIAMFIAAGHGLAAAHAVGLVHRDFKPENVLIGKDGRVRVTDFGLADRAATPIDPVVASTAIADRDRTTTGLLAGTPFYMAPEQMSRERVDARTDQFSFCVAIYAALTGEHPFSARGRTGQLADRPRRDAVPAWLWRAVRPGLALDRGRRYPSMDALLSRLAVGPRRQRQIGLAAVVAVAGAGLAGVAGFDARTGESGPTCQGAERLLTGAWDRERAHAIDEAFRASRRTDAAATFASASLLLDQYAKRWIAMRTEACEQAHLGSDHSDAIWNLRISCLDARLSELRVLTSRFASADDAVVDGAVVSVQALGTLRVCADDDALQRPTQPDVAARPGAVVALDADRQLSYLVTDSEGSLWQVRTAGSATDRNRAYIVDAVVGRPAIVEDAEHRWQVFARRVNRTVSRGWQQVPGGAWQAAQFTDSATDDPTAVLVADRLVYFVRRTDGWLWRYWQDAPSGSTWTAVRVADVVTGRPGVGFDAAGELYTFVRKADGSLWYARHAHPTEPPDRPVKVAENIAGDPTFVLDAADKMTFYVRRTNGSLMAGYQAIAGSPVWHSVTLTNGVAGNPAVAFDAEGKQICLIRKTDGSLWSATQDTPARGPWHDAILTDGIADDPTLVLDTEGHLTYLVRKTDGSLWQGRQDAPLSTIWHEHVLE